MTTEFYELERNNLIEFDYMNWKGEKRKQKAFVYGFGWGCNEQYKEPQLLLKAIDFEKKVFRFFAVKDIENLEVL